MKKVVNWVNELSRKANTQNVVDVYPTSHTEGSLKTDQEKTTTNQNSNP